MPVSKEDAVRELAYRLWARGAVNTGLICRIGSTRNGDSEDDPGPPSDESEPPIKVSNPRVLEGNLRRDG